MADAASIGASFGSHQANPLLGNYQGEAFKIDMKPVEMLAAYTNLQNKTLWEQQQKNADKMVDLLSNMADIDVNYLYGNDRTKMIDDIANANRVISDKLRRVPSNPREYANWYADAQKVVGDVAAKYATRKERAVSRVQYLDKLNEKYGNDGKAISAMTQEYDKVFNSTDGKVPSLPAFDVITLPSPKPATTTVQVFRGGAGADVNREFDVTLLNPYQSRANISSGLLFQGQKESLFPPEKIKDAKGNDVDNPAYQKWAQGKSEQEILQAKMQNLGNPDTYSLAQQMTNLYNSSIKNYIKPDGTIDEVKLNSHGDAMTKGIYFQMKDASEWSAKKDAQFAQPNGIYSDKGVDYNVPKPVDNNTFKAGIISDLTNVTPEDIMWGRIFAESEKEKVGIKNTATGLASTNRRDALNRAQRRSEQGLDMIKAGFKYDKKEGWKFIGKPNSKDAQTGISMPAQLYYRDINNVKKLLAKNPDQPTVSIEIKALDKYSKAALGIPEGVSVGSIVFDRATGNFQADGTTPEWMDSSGKKQKGEPFTIKGTPLTLAQGFIDQFKKDNPKISEGALEQFGGSPQEIWDNGVDGMFGGVSSTTQPAGKQSDWVAYHGNKDNVRSIDMKTGIITYKDDSKAKMVKVDGKLKAQRLN